MMQARKTEMLERMLADPDIAPEIKALLEAGRAEGEPDDPTQDTQPDPRAADILRRLLSEDDEGVDEEKVAQADHYFEGVKDYLADRGWRATVADPERRAFALGFSMRHTSLRVLLRIDADAQCLSITVTLPVACPPPYRMLLAGTLCKLNRSFRYGAFQLDEDDGEVTYRLTYAMGEQAFCAATFDRYLDSCLITSDLNFGRIARVAKGAMSREEQAAVLAQLKALATEMASA